MNAMTDTLDRTATREIPQAGHSLSPADIRWAQTRAVVGKMAPKVIRKADADDAATLDAITGTAVDMLAATGSDEVPESMIVSYVTMTLAAWQDAA